jgi:ferredoxin-thioredoxin reductase catalytic subunit
MSEKPVITPAEVEQYYQKLKAEAASSGYHLNPDIDFTKELVQSLLVNSGRYGYPVCPCRLAAGEKAQDLDIVCPCDYRDADLNQYSTCYCSLYVSGQIAEGREQLSGSIPERRGQGSAVKMGQSDANSPSITNLPFPVWRCKVCGYLCARENPPLACPICKAGKERFEKFI